MQFDRATLDKLHLLPFLAAADRNMVLFGWWGYCP